MPTDIPGSDLPQAFVEPFDVTSASNLAARWASGSLVSNGDDVATFYSAPLGGKLLPRALLDEMLHTFSTGDPTERAGLGIFRVRTECGFAWGHGASPPAT